jgi:GNAT superfamily N-acetyltransferase
MITLKPIAISDLERYAALCDELFGSKTNLVQLEAALHKIISNPDYILVGAENENRQLLGSVMGITCMDTVGECRPFMVLENLVVSGKCRRLGIGKMLVDYIEEQARGNNCYFVMLMSLIKRKEAHQFYEALGYSTTIAQGYKKYL